MEFQKARISMKTRTRRTVMVSLIAAFTVLLSWAIIGIVTRINDLPNRISIDGDACAAAVTRFYREALSSDDPRSQRRVIHDLSHWAVRDDTTKAWIREEYSDDIRRLATGDDAELAADAAEMLCLLGGEDTPAQASNGKSPRHVEVSDLAPHLDGGSVVMSFKVANTHGISGAVPNGQPGSFGITPVVKPSDPRFSVLVMGDLADLMGRFGYAPPRPSDPARGLRIEARGEIRYYPAPEPDPSKGPSFVLRIHDWKGFRITSPLPRSGGKSE